MNESNEEIAVPTYQTGYSMGFAKRLGGFVWYFSVFLLIVLAVLLSAARILLPEVRGYRERVEHLVSEALGQPVSIGSMDARIRGLSAEFTFRDVAVAGPPPEEGQPAPRFQAIQLSLDVFGSAMHRQVVLDDVAVIGAELSVRRMSDGQVRIEGLTLPSAAPAAPSDNDGALNLVRDGRIAVRNSRLTFRDDVRNRTMTFAPVNLEWQAVGGGYRLVGDVVLPEKKRRQLRLVLDIDGNPLDPVTWKGDVYAKAVHVEPAQWLDGKEYKGIKLEQGAFDLEFWAHWDGKGVTWAQGRFDFADVKAKGPEGSLLLDRITGYLKWQRLRQGWRLDLGEFTMARDGEAWEPSRVVVERDAQGGRVMADFLRVDDIVAVIESMPLPSDSSVGHWLSALRPGGDVTDLRVDYRQGGQFRLQTGLVNAHVNAWKRFPGVSGLNGRVRLDSQGGDAYLDSSELTLSLPRVFPSPLALGSVKGGIRLEREAEGWNASAEGVHVSNDDVTLEADLALTWPGKGTKPFLDLRGVFRDGNAASASKYIPAGVLKEKTAGWLQRAFKAGSVKSGEVIFHGNLADFPFRDNSGVFQVTFAAEDVELEFDERWPHLTGIDGEVAIDGSGLNVSARSAQFLGGKVTTASVSIADFRHAELQVAGRASLSGGQVLRFFRETPLSERYASALKGMRANGGAGLDLSLRIPLAAELKTQRPLHVGGRLRLKGTNLTVIDGVTFEGLQGAVDFDDAVVRAKGVQGRLFNSATNIVVLTEGNGNKTTYVGVRGETGATELKDAFSFAMLDFLEGKAAWQATLEIPHQHGADVRLRLASDLAGMGVNLPKPVGKPAQAGRWLDSSIVLSGKREGLIELAYGSNLRVVLLRSKQDGGLERAAVNFGPHLPALPEERLIRISGSLEELTPSDWQEVLKTAGSGGEDRQTLPIEVRMQRLQLRSPAKETQRSPSAKASVTGYPPMKVLIEDLHYDGTALGRLEFRLIPEHQRLKVQGLSLKQNKAYVLTGQGEWQQRTDGGETLFDLKLTTDDVGRMMRSLGFVSVITDGNAVAEGRLGWPGPPGAGGPESLRGKVKVRIEKGSIEEVDPGNAGRMLGLLSLRALPRRLVLDFTDLSGSGFGFDTIKGDLRFEGGNIFTDNLRIDAPAAKVEVEGRTGLVARDFDQVVSVIPNVSDTLPIAGLAFSPQVGAALLLLKGVFKTGIDEGSMLQYQVTGSWDSPVITPIPYEK